MIFKRSNILEFRKRYPKWMDDSIFLPPYKLFDFRVVYQSWDVFWCKDHSEFGSRLKEINYVIYGFHLNPVMCSSMKELWSSVSKKEEMLNILFTTLNMCYRWNSLPKIGIVRVKFANEFSELKYFTKYSRLYEKNFGGNKIVQW